MRQVATHEPRYKSSVRNQTNLKKNSRYEHLYEPQKDSNTEEYESEEESDETMEGQMGAKDAEWDDMGRRMMDRRGTFSKIQQPENFILHSYFLGNKELRRDRITQKNYNSPIPSFIKPPGYREYIESPKSRLSTVKSSREAEIDCPSFAKSPKSSSKNLVAFGTNNETICFHHYRHRDNFGPKIYEKHKDSKMGSSKLGQSDFSFLHNGEFPTVAEKVSQVTIQTEGFTKNSTDVTTTDTSGNGPRPRVFREDESPKVFARCGDCLRAREGRRLRYLTVKPSDSERELMVHDSFLTKQSTDGESLGQGSKVREKLVYVVEEEGKGVAKMETDLISLSEILAIKKDLLELSEFAKKLKKLKEARREKEKGKAHNKSCHCKPVAELLKDVNRRIEALEARQEELERGSISKENCGDMAEGHKTSSETPPKTPVMTKQSAMTSVPSFPKTEMIVSRAGGFSNNSEIVNELMDIKSQLQRLEKRRMSKELSAEAVPPGGSKAPQKKEHAIAVFSSRTYILTTDNYKSNKAQTLGEKVKDSLILNESKWEKAEKIEENKAKPETEKAKETVVNWLRNVAYLSDESNQQIVREEVAEETKNKSAENGSGLKCRTCAQVLKNEDFEYQETQNRETSKEKKKPEFESWVLESEKPRGPPWSSSREFGEPVECRECLMTPSGRVFTANNKLPVKVIRNFLAEEISSKPPKNPCLLRQSVSSSSIPSVVAAKERLKKQSKSPTKGKQEKFLAQSRSKSMQKLISVSNPSGEPKKNDEVAPKDKKSKESQNEMVKRELEDNMKKKREQDVSSSFKTVSSESQFLGTVNLESGHSEKHIRNLGTEFKGAIFNNLQLYSLTTLSGNDFQYCSPADKFAFVVQHPEMKDRELERKKRKKHKSEINKHNLKTASSKIEKSSEFKREKKSKPSKHHRKCKKPQSKERGYAQSIFNCPRHKTTAQMIFSAAEDRRDYHFRSKDLTQIKMPNSKKHRRQYYTCELQDYGEQDTEDSEEFKESRKNIDKYSRKSKTKQSDDKPEEDSCTLRNFFKNFRGLYPRFSSLRVIPWLGYCDKQPKMKESGKKLKDEKETDETEDEDEYDQCVDYQGNQKHHKGCNNDAREEHLKKCKCVQVYLQSQENREWPGSRPFRNPEDELDEISTCSECSSISFDKESSVYCVGHSSEVKKKPKKHHRSSYDEDDTKHKKHSKKHKKEEKHKKKRSRKCVCDKCGNVHKRKKPKKRKKRKKKECTTESETSSKPSRDEDHHKKEENHERNFDEAKSEKHSPVLSFLRGWCPKAKQSKASVCNKFNEIRYLKTCRGKTRSNKSKKTHHNSRAESRSSKHKEEEFRPCRCHKKKRSESEESKESEESEKSNNSPETEASKSETTVHDKCHCKRKLEHIEDRLKALEKHKKRKSKKSSSSESSGKKKKRKKKKKHSSESSDEEKDKNKKESHNDTTAAYYCTCLSFDRAQPNPTPRTTTEETSSYRPEAGDVFRYGGKKLREKFSSIQSLWKNIRKHKEKKDIIDEPVDDFLDDCSRSSPVPKMKAIQAMKDEPTKIFTKIKKKKKRKEKGTSEKSKPRSKRHK